MAGKKNEEKATTEEATGLATMAQISQSLPMQKYGNEDVNEMLKSPFPPRFQICSSSAEIVQTGLVPMGHFALVWDKNRVTPLGSEVDILTIAFRPKALRIPKDGSNPMSYYKRGTPEFEKVQSDSKVQNSGCLFGLEFLVYVPKTEQWATLFLGTPSARKEAPSLLAEMKKNPDGSERDAYGPCKVTCRGKLCSNAKGRWHVAQFFPCTSELASMPTLEEIKDEVEKFNNPPDSMVEKAEPEAADARAR